MNDRRLNRSHIPQLAVGLYLQAALARVSNGPKAIVIANEDGLLVGGAGQGYDLTDVAALAPTCASGSATKKFENLMEEVTHGDDLYVSRLMVHGQTLYLASLGGRLPRQHEAADALTRILASMA